MRWLNKIVLQNVEGIRDDNWCTETSMRHDKDNRRNQYNDYEDRGNNPKSEHQQLNYEHYQYSRNIRGLMISNLKQYERSDISNSKNVSWWTRCI